MMRDLIQDLSSLAAVFAMIATAVVYAGVM
jgi:hypothetical protein